MDPVESTFSTFGAATTRSLASLGNGTYTFYVKARDQAGNEDTSPASRLFTVNAANITIDDGAPGTTSTGTWCASSAADFYGSDSLYSCGTGLDTYRWTPTMVAAGTYDVYVWWSTHSNRSTGVPITVVHAAGTTTQTYNEQTGGGQWVLHGRYNFAAGTSGYVEVSSANGQAAADAVLWIPSTGGPPGPAITLDTTQTSPGVSVGVHVRNATGTETLALHVVPQPANSQAVTSLPLSGPNDDFTTQSDGPGVIAFRLWAGAPGASQLIAESPLLFVRTGDGEHVLQGMLTVALPGFSWQSRTEALIHHRLAITYRSVTGGCQPKLWVDQTIIAVGNVVTCNSNQPLTLTIAVDNRVPRTINKDIRAADLATHVIVPKITLGTPAEQTLLDARVRAWHDAPPTDPAESLREIMSLTGETYYQLVDGYANGAAATLGIAEYTWEVAILVASHTPGGPAVIDGVSMSIRPVASDGNADTFVRWMAAIGVFGSEMEAAAIEKALGVKAVSTTRILNAASDQGVELVQVTPANLDAQLPRLTALPLSIINALTHEVRTLKRNAIVPIAPVVAIPGGPSDFALWSLDPNTGEGLYLIGAQLLNGGSSPPIPLDPTTGIPKAVQLFRTALGLAAAAETIEVTAEAAAHLARAGITLIATNPRTLMSIGSGVMTLTFGALPLAAISVGVGGVTVYIIYRCATGQPVPFVCPGQ